jgi:carbamoyltransferase
MQRVAEEAAAHMLKHVHRLTRCKDVVLSGGFFMNSVFNGKVIDKSPFKKVYIPYAPADLGNSIGAALYTAHCILGEKRNFSYQSSLIGPSYGDSDIKKTLERRRISHTFVKQKEKQIARLLSEGNIVAVLDGRMEFGERALGSRSILADPRKADMKDRINSMIKYRESYRPFAPATLAEKAHVYFEVGKGYESDYMEKVVPVRAKYRKLLPAITHVDGSGRLQTVSREHQKTFHETIVEFEKLTGFPVVLNTSFNLNGEPIVLSPDDALNTFFNSGLMHMFMGSCYITKR